MVLGFPSVLKSELVWNIFNNLFNFTSNLDGELQYSEVVRLFDVLGSFHLKMNVLSFFS